MTRLFSAAFVAALALPAALGAQTAPAQQTSPFAALELRQELQLTPAQFQRITVARDSLREAHRVHCGPMHASTPTEAEEARHHEEMAAINARWEGEARAAMTPAQMQRLATLVAARPAAPAAGHGDHHAAPAAGHSGHGTQTAPAAGHSGHPKR